MSERVLQRVQLLWASNHLKNIKRQWVSMKVLRMELAWHEICGNVTKFLLRPQFDGGEDNGGGLTKFELTRRLCKLNFQSYLLLGYFQVFQHTSTGATQIDTSRSSSTAFWRLNFDRWLALDLLTGLFSSSWGKTNVVSSSDLGGVVVSLSVAEGISVSSKPWGRTRFRRFLS